MLLRWSLCILTTYRYIAYQIPIQNCHTVSKTGASENKTCLCFHSLCKTFFEYHESLWRKFLPNFYVIQNVTTSSHFYNNRIVLKQLYFILLCVLLKIFMGMPIFSARLWAAPSIAVSSGEFNSNIWVAQAYQGLYIYK